MTNPYTDTIEPRGLPVWTGTETGAVLTHLRPGCTISRDGTPDGEPVTVTGVMQFYTAHLSAIEVRAADGKRYLCSAARGSFPRVYLLAL